MINNYASVVDKIKEEILSWIIGFEGEEIFIMGKDFMRFRFKTNDKLVYNREINIPVCAVSLSSVIKKVIFIIHCLNYKKSFMKLKNSN